MKIEYIAEGGDGYPIIRIYGAQSFDALIDAFKKLSSGDVNEIYVQKLVGFEAIEDCSLLLSIGDRDEGIAKVGGKNKFIWMLTRSTWDDLAALIEPFSKFDGYYIQWLAGGEARMGNLANSEIALVISTYPDGQW
jgi:hypothetical protein